MVQSERILAIAAEGTHLRSKEEVWFLFYVTILVFSVITISQKHLYIVCMCKIKLATGASLHIFTVIDKMLEEAGMFGGDSPSPP